jgi:DNA-binding response OmpR family regulator
VEKLALRGHSILLVENEPLIALDVQRSLQAAGANVLCACTLERALGLVDRAGLSAAVLDYGLTGGNCEPVCERLQQRGIPVVFYSGYPDLRQRFPDAVIIHKPAPLDDVTEALCALLSPTIALARLPSTRTDHARR